MSDYDEEVGYQPAEFTTTATERRTDGHVRTERKAVVDLFSRFVDESRTLALLELKLAKSELSEKIDAVQRGAISIGTGSFILYAGILTLIGSAVAALSQIWEVWLAALVVGAVVCVIGGIMLAVGRSNLKKERLELKQTRETLQEGKQWAKSQMR